MRLTKQTSTLRYYNWNTTKNFAALANKLTCSMSFRVPSSFLKGNYLVVHLSTITLMIIVFVHHFVNEQSNL